ncbi:MAG: hypothetical protein R3Y21_03760 [Mycoplasmatota bacterium]
MKKNKILFMAIATLLLTSGCFGEEQSEINSNLAETKNNMINNLETYSYDVIMTTDVSYMTIETEMNCAADLNSEITYCKSTTMGIITETYTDYGNDITYSNTTYTDWESSSLDSSINQIDGYLNVIEYIYDVKTEETSTGTLYSGYIDSSKLLGAMSESDDSLSSSSADENSIYIEVLVNDDNYVETIYYDMEISGMSYEIEVEYYDYNTSKSLVIPDILQ